MPCIQLMCLVEYSEKISLPSTYWLAVEMHRQSKCAGQRNFCGVFSPLRFLVRTGTLATPCTKETTGLCGSVRSNFHRRKIWQKTGWVETQERIRRIIASRSAGRMLASVYNICVCSWLLGQFILIASQKFLLRNPALRQQLIRLSQITPTQPQQTRSSNKCMYLHVRENSQGLGS